MAELADDTKQHEAALRVLAALHRAGFTSVWMQDVLYFTGGLREGKTPREEVTHHNLRLVLDETEMGPDRFAEVLAVARDHDATVGLTQIRMHQQEFSRLTLWPKGDGDDA